MPFKIKNAEGAGIAINDLDKEACDFWNVELHDKNYAKPKNQGNDWYDTLGFYAHTQMKGQVDWDTVIGLLTSHVVFKLNGKEKYLRAHYELHNKPKVRSTDEQFTYDVLGCTIAKKFHYYLPYIELAHHWKEKGYTIHSV